MPTLRVHPKNSLVFVDSEGEILGDIGWKHGPQSGDVAAGSAAVLHMVTLKEGQSLILTSTKLLQSNLDPVSDGVDMVIADDESVLETVHAGDGATVFDELADIDDDGEITEPIAEYENTTGEEKIVIIAIDNGNFGDGTGDPQDVYADFNGRVIA